MVAEYSNVERVSAKYTVHPNCGGVCCEFFLENPRIEPTLLQTL